MWEIELGGEILEHDELVVAQRGRLIRRVGAWDDASAQWFAGACAERVGVSAAEAQRRSGSTAAAARLEQAADLQELQRAAVEAQAVGGGGPAEIAAFAADLVSLVAGARPEAWLSDLALAPANQSPAATAANAAFVAAHAAGRAAVVASRNESDYADAFAAERAWQLSALRERLALPA